MNTFWGMKILWIFFILFLFFGGGGVSQNWTTFRGHLYAFQGLFLRLMYRLGDILGVAKTSNIFLGA